MAITPEMLLRAAENAQKNAYVPYSGEAYGAALLGADRVVYTGATVENIAPYATLCAEHAAVAKALSKGCKSFQAIAVVSKKRKMALPCGRCRQVLAEFSPGLVVILRGEHGEAVKYKLSELLPRSFTLKV